MGMKAVISKKFIGLEEVQEFQSIDVGFVDMFILLIPLEMIYLVSKLLI